MRRLAGESPGWSSRLLCGEDAPPFVIHNQAGASPLVLVCDHAGRAVPRRLRLGVPAAEMDRHIAWDVGAGKLTLALSRALDASAVLQPYSRLVVDCNRAPDRPDAMPEVSDGTAVPGNCQLSPADRAERVAAIHEPYHARISALLDDRAAAGRPTMLVLMHSFTPVMAGVSRPWRFGVLHTRQRLALAVLERLRAADAGEIGDNEPYVMDETDYTAARHGRSRGLDFVEIEVRQDLITDSAGQGAVGDLLAPVLAAATADVAQT